MCLAVPMKVIDVHGETGVVESHHVRQQVNLALLGDVKVNDWVIVHAGFAISKMNRREAGRTRKLLVEAGYIPHD